MPLAICQALPPMTSLSKETWSPSPIKTAAATRARMCFPGADLPSRCSTLCITMAPCEYPARTISWPGHNLACFFRSFNVGVTPLPRSLKDFGSSGLARGRGCRGGLVEGQEVGDAEEAQYLAFDGPDVMPALVVKHPR